MALFKPEDKILDIIEQNYHLLPVLNRFGIRLGFGDATVADICEVKNINSAFFLDIINAFHHPGYFPESEFLTFSPVLIVDYLQQTHYYYLNWVVPKLESQLESLIQSGIADNTNLRLLRIFFRKYKSELISHIMDEEESVFPYISRIYDAFETKGSLTAEDHKKSILDYEKEHSNVDEKLNDLKNLVIKYLVADYDNNLCNDFLITLLRFERDLIDHARIEDKILVPVVLKIENAVKYGR